MIYLYQTLQIFLRAMEIAIFAYFLLSLLAPRSTLAHHIGRFIEPFLRPFRVINMKIAARFALPVDLTLLFALIGIDVIRYFLARLFIALL